jgi:hypothetical protein
MPGKGTQHQFPLILQLVKNREEQQAADAQKNSSERAHGLQFFARQPKEGVDFKPVIAWVGVFFRLFWLSMLSGSLFLVWVFALKLAGY